MKRKNVMMFKRMIAFCLILVFACGISLNAYADYSEGASEATDDRTIVIHNQDGSVMYQALQEPAAENSDMQEELVFTPTQGDGESEGSISPYALSAMNKVNNTVAEPYKYVCYVEATFPDGAVVGSSGVLVHNNILLTAAHGIYDQEHGGHATKILVWPASSYDSNKQLHMPYDCASYTSTRIHISYMNDKNPEYDWALVDLNIRYEHWQAFGYSPDYSQLTGRTVRAIGYFPDQYGNNMYEAEGTVKNSYERQLHLSVKVNEGQSGGPVIDKETGAVIGVITGYEVNIIGWPLYTISVNIDKFLYDLINEHKAEMQ